MFVLIDHTSMLTTVGNCVAFLNLAMGLRTALSLLVCCWKLSKSLRAVWATSWNSCFQMEEEAEEQVRKCQAGFVSCPNELDSFVSFVPLQTELLLYLLPFVTAVVVNGIASDFVGPAGLLPWESAAEKICLDLFGLNGT